MSKFSQRRRNAPLPTINNSVHSSDVDFMTYLRTAGGTVDDGPRQPRLERTESAERKRRHTGSEPERRDYPYPYLSNRGAHSSRFANGVAPAADSVTGSQNLVNTGGVIDLTGPDEPYRPTMTNNMRSLPYGGRRESDITLPKWQPDSEVSKCPVCNTDFNFLYRKHHCRKCGRVVCSNCSPHRITIPRQYIVRAPTHSDDDAVSPTRTGGNPALGGGEVVRVCNPCVPDPWTPGTGPSRSREEVQTSSRSANVDVPPPQSMISSLARRESGERPDRYRHTAVPTPTRNRSNTYQPTLGRPPSTFRSGYPASYSNNTQETPYPRLSSRYGHRHSQSSADRSMPPPMPTSRPPPPPPPSQPSIHPPVPRRQVREEDECPVCGIEMPPGESVREVHIQECIASRFSSTPAQPAPPASGTAVPSPAADTFGTSASSSATPPPVPEGSRPRATSYRPRGMALYKATEKDCTTEDGEPQECVICFEEFETGDEMGRMECLCKFHRACIREWWETKGAGSCPTHQHY